LWHLLTTPLKTEFELNRLESIFWNLEMWFGFFKSVFAQVAVFRYPKNDENLLAKYCMSETKIFDIYFLNAYNDQFMNWETEHNKGLI